MSCQFSVILSLWKTQRVFVVHFSCTSSIDFQLIHVRKCRAAVLCFLLLPVLIMCNHHSKNVCCPQLDVCFCIGGVRAYMPNISSVHTHYFNSITTHLTDLRGKRAGGLLHATNAAFEWLWLLLQLSSINLNDIKRMDTAHPLLILTTFSGNRVSREFSSFH